MIHHFCFPLEMRRYVSGTSESVSTAHSTVTSGLIGSLAFTHLWLSFIPLRNKWVAVTGLFMQQRGETETTFPFYVVENTTSHTSCYIVIPSLFLCISNAFNCSKWWQETDEMGSMTASKITRFYRLILVCGWGFLMRYFSLKS